MTQFLDFSLNAYLLSGEIPLRFDEMVFALGEDRDVVLLDNRRVLSQLDQLEVDCVGFI